MGDVAQAIGVCDVASTGAYCSIILDLSHDVRTYICVLIKFHFPRVTREIVYVDFVSDCLYLLRPVYVI